MPSPLSTLSKSLSWLVLRITLVGVFFGLCGAGVTADIWSLATDADCGAHCPCDEGDEPASSHEARADAHDDHADTIATASPHSAHDEADAATHERADDDDCAPGACDECKCHASATIALPSLLAISAPAHLLSLQESTLLDASASGIPSRHFRPPLHTSI